MTIVTSSWGRITRAHDKLLDQKLPDNSQEPPGILEALLLSLISPAILLAAGTKVTCIPGKLKSTSYKV